MEKEEKKIDFSMISYFLLLISIHLLSTSCEPPCPPIPYYTLSAEDIQWLDLNGYWVYEDSLKKLLGHENYTDTVFGTASVVYKKTNIESVIYYDEVRLMLSNTFFHYFGDFTLILRSVIFLPLPMSTDPHIAWASTIEDRKCVTINNNDNKVSFFRPFGPKDTQYFFEKGIGITKVVYNDGDSINTVLLVDHILN